MLKIMINFSFQEIKDVKNAAFQSVVTFEMLLHDNGNSELNERYESLPNSIFRIFESLN